MSKYLQISHTHQNVSFNQTSAHPALYLPPRGKAEVKLMQTWNASLKCVMFRLLCVV